MRDFLEDCVISFFAILLIAAMLFITFFPLLIVGITGNGCWALLLFVTLPFGLTIMDRLRL